MRRAVPVRLPLRKEPVNDMGRRKHFATAILAAMVTAVSAAAQTPEEADAAFRAQDWTGAARVYATLAERAPEDGRTWFRLGYARHQLGQYAGAAQAWEQAEAAGFAPAFTRYNLAAAYARMGEDDRAFAWLDEAVAAGYRQVEGLRADEDFARLRDDVRFEAVVTATDRNARPCAFDERRRTFDFWAGEWVVTNPQGQEVGTNRIEKIQNECALRENWTGAGGVTGTSYNYFDPDEEQWHQLWVDAGGNHATFTGTFHDGAMRFEGAWVGPDGAASRMKMTFTPLPDGRVRQYIEQSTDGGRTYRVWFDGYYARKPSP